MIANRGLVPLENLVVSSFSIIRHGLQMTPRVSAAPSRRGHLQSVLRDETLQRRLFRA